MDSYNIGKKIKDLRIKNNLTLEQLGNKINFNVSNLSKIERGKRKPTLELLESLSDFFKVDVAYFFDATKQDTPDELKEYVEWIAFADEMKEKDLSPEQIKEIIEFLHTRIK